MDPIDPTPPRRKRGRPPKSQTTAIPHRPRPTKSTPGDQVSSSHTAREQESSGHTPEASTAQSSTPQLPKRGRGRPPGSKVRKRVPIALLEEEDIDEVDEEEPPTPQLPKRGRGRPPGSKGVKKLPMALVAEEDLGEDDEGEPSVRKVSIKDLSEKDRKALEVWIPQGKHKTAQRQSYLELNTAYHRGVAASTEYHKQGPRPMTKERYEDPGMPGCPILKFDELWGPQDEQQLMEKWDASAENAALNALTRWTEMLSLWKVSLRRFQKDPLSIIAWHRDLEVDTSLHDLVEHNGTRSRNPLWSQQFSSRLTLIMAHPLWEGNPAFLFMRFVIKWAAICRTDYRGSLTEQDMELLSVIRSKIQPRSRHKSMGEQHQASQRKLQRAGSWSTTEANLLTKIWKMTSVSAEPESSIGMLRVNAGDLGVIVNALNELNASGMTISCETHLHIHRAGRGTTGYPTQSDLKDLYKNCVLSLWRKNLRHRAMGETGHEGSESMDSGPQTSQVGDPSGSHSIDTALQDISHKGSVDGDSDQEPDFTGAEDPMTLDDDSCPLGGHEVGEIDLPYEDGPGSQQDSTEPTGHSATLPQDEEAVRPTRDEVTKVTRNTPPAPTQSNTDDTNKTTDVQMPDADTIPEAPGEFDELENGTKGLPDTTDGSLPVEAHVEVRATQSSKRHGDEIEEQPSPKRPRGSPKATKPPSKWTGRGTISMERGQLMERTGGTVDDNFDESSSIEDPASPKATSPAPETATKRGQLMEQAGSDVDDNFDESSAIEDPASPKATSPAPETATKRGQLMEQAGSEVDDNFDEPSSIEDPASPKATSPAPETATKPGQLMEQAGSEADDDFDKLSSIGEKACPKAAPPSPKTSDPTATATNPVQDEQQLTVDRVGDVMDIDAVVCPKVRQDWVLPLVRGRKRVFEG